MRLARTKPAGQAGNQDAAQPGPDWRRLVLRLAGGGLLVATAAIHLDLYLTGYRTIPTIGWLFLLQVIAAFVLGLAVLAIPARLVVPGRVAAVAGAGFAASTLGGYLLTVWIGLFGFKEVSTTAGIVAGVIEIVAIAVLAVLALLPAPDGTPARFPAQIPAALTRAGGATAGAAVVAGAVLLGVALAGAAAPPAPATAGGTAGGTTAGATLKTTTIGGVKILTNAKGFTLYSFAPDTPTTSKCYGSCAAYWPPVTGTAAGTSLPGKVTTITRTDGSHQLTYNGHPLYTYIGDSHPGQDSGNKVNLNGGLWLDVPVSK